jgi:hypothetical protein
MLSMELYLIFINFQFHRITDFSLTYIVIVHLGFDECLFL